MDSSPRWIRVARALCLPAAACGLTLLLSPVSRFALDPEQPLLQPLRTSPPIVALIATHARRYALDPALLRAVIRVESNFNAQAVSPKGALGLMQLMPMTAAAFHVLDPFDPNDNIRGGAALLRRLLDRFGGDLALALAAYHAGERRVSQAAVSTDTQRYVEQVLRHYDRFAAGRSLSAVWAERMSRRTAVLSPSSPVAE